MKHSVIATVRVGGCEVAVPLDVVVPEGDDLYDMLKNRVTLTFKEVIELTTVDELCQYCEAEVELRCTKTIAHVECPNCHKPIRPCSLCKMDEVDCADCNSEDVFRGYTTGKNLVEGLWVERDGQSSLQTIECYKTGIRFKVTTWSMEMLNILGEWQKLIDK